jgi:Glycosyl hydrolases family 16
MAGLKFSLGLIPDTTKVEEAENKLWKDFEAFKSFEASEELRHYESLKTTISSADFAQKKKEILGRKFKNTEEFKKLSGYKALEKSAAIKNYFKVKESQQLKSYTDLEGSDLLKRLAELEKFMKSDLLSKAKASLGPKEFKESDEAKKEKEYIQLQKNPNLKKHFKFEESKAFSEYKRIAGSEELKKFTDLKEFVNSPKFKEVQDYMALSPKKKYEISEEYKQETEYKELAASEKIVWFYKTKKKYPFGEIEKLELRFEDKFESAKPDAKIWMNRYINGDKVLKRPYVLADDKHAFADGRNIEVSNNKLRILTKKESGKSYTWNPMTGFTEKEFEFTSDMISTAKSFKQKHGIFKAKIKFGNTDVTQAFSLQVDEMLPHIDIAKVDKNKLFAGNFWKNGGNNVSKSLSKTGAGRYKSNFYIISLEWEPGKLVWKINDMVFKTQTQGIPDYEMHLVFNASLKDYASENGLPSAFEIDWVKVYSKKV